jgi:BolA protein
MTTVAATGAGPVGAAAIEARLRESFPEASVVSVGDDSAAHAGHAGAREGGHYRVVIRSHRFDNMSRLARHRLVYDSLSSYMQRGIHALVIDAEPPGPVPSSTTATSASDHKP